MCNINRYMTTCMSLPYADLKCSMITMKANDAKCKTTAFVNPRSLFMPPAEFLFSF